MASYWKPGRPEIMKQKDEQVKKIFDKTFYVCGPPVMMDAVQGYLAELGVTNNSVVVEI